MKTIILISCCSKKLKGRCPASEMYISARFRHSLQYAKKLRPDMIFILSSKHGLLKLDTEIEPYNETLNTKSVFEVATWSARVVEELCKVSDLEKDMFIFLAGEKYRRDIIPYLNHYRIPLKNLKIGQQLRKLKLLCK